MARKPQQTKAERLENLAFWYWEYQRRNPVYRRWSEVLERFVDIFEPHEAILEELWSPEGLVEMIEFERSMPTYADWKTSKFVKWIESKLGSEVAQSFYKYSALNRHFERKFKRPQSCHEYGIDTEVYLQKILDREEPAFKPYEVADLAALLRMHNDWIVQMNGMDPSHTFSMIAEHVTIPIGPHVPLEVFKKASLECEVLYLISQTAAFWNEDEPALDEEVAESTLELLTDLDSVNTANIMRLAVLWLWDRMEEDDDESLDFDAKFKKHWGVLKDRANSAGLDEAPWNQIYDKKKRVLTALLNTNDCIMQMKIIDLNTKR